jgi:hypothetical protein
MINEQERIEKVKELYRLIDKKNKLILEINKLNDELTDILDIIDYISETLNED